MLVSSVEPMKSRSSYQGRSTFDGFIYSEAIHNGSITYLMTYCINSLHDRHCTLSLFIATLSYTVHHPSLTRTPTQHLYAW